MKNMNMLRRALAMIICLCMMLTALTLISCNTEESTETQTEAENEELVEVLRFAKNVKAGSKITAEDIEKVSLKKTDIIINAITDETKVIGKYAAADLFKGDFITPSKVLNTLKEAQESIGFDAEFDIDQVLISDYASLASNGDYTNAIKTAIKENPGKTIYFADGEYTISDPIVISADSTIGVSFRLGNYATIKAASTWADKEKTMLRIGVEEETVNDDVFAQRNTYVTGGIIDASGVATGITVEGGKDILVSNVTIKNAYQGLCIKAGDNDLNATYADFENIVVIGNSEEGSVGVIVEGAYNSLTNFKISHAQYAFVATETGDNNVFKSIMAIGTGIPEGLDIKEIAGFVDLSGGNNYDMCYSDQYATAFLIAERSRSVYNACVASWWSADNGYHVGFRVIDEGCLNATILYSKVYHTHTVDVDAYLLADMGGDGSVQYPFDQVVSDTYHSILTAYCNTDILG